MNPDLRAIEATILGEPHDPSNLSPEAASVILPLVRRVVQERDDGQHEIDKLRSSRATTSPSTGYVPFPPPNWHDDLTGWNGEEHGWLTPSGWRDVNDPAREGMDCGEDLRASDGKPAYVFSFSEAVGAWAADPEACELFWASTKRG